MKIKTISKIIFLIFFFALSASASLANCIESTGVDELGLETCPDNYQWNASQEMCCPTSNNSCVNANFNTNPPPQYSCNPGFSLQSGDPMLCCPIEGYVEEVAKPGCAWEAKPAGFVCPTPGGQGDCGSHPGSTGDNNMSWFCCCSAIHRPQQRPKDLNPLGNLNVKIPGLDKLAKESPINCEKDKNGQTVCKVPWIGLYIKAIYDYSLSIVGLIAGITILFAGVIWLTAGGNASAVESAKNWIIASLSGVVLLFASYLILFTINPNLISMKPLELGSIDPIAGDTSSPSNNGQGGPFTSIDNSEILERAEIYCPRSGGSSEIRQIAESFRNKVVYRLGSKNGEGDEYNPERAEPTYGLSCPNRNPWNEKILCYDCSGFVRQVLWCAGLESNPGMGTSMMFPGTEEIDSCEGDLINNKKLNPGDLVGWYPRGDGSNSGHVFIYIGNGQVADVWGNRKYSPAGAYKTGNLCQEVKKYEERIKPRKLHVRRISF